MELLRKNFSDLFPANQILDDDILAIFKPNVYNVVTQRNGDSFKITASDLFNYCYQKQQKLEVGEYVFYNYQPDPVLLAKKRHMVLNFQIIEIALYSDLCELKWVGSAANASASFWYKCNADGTRNVNGQYMRVEDGRGMFYRGAGANAVLKAANNTPYDGGTIGEHQPDQLQYFGCPVFYNNTNQPVGNGNNGQLNIGTQGGIYTASGNNQVAFPAGISVHPAPRMGSETKGVSMAYLACIKY